MKEKLRRGKAKSAGWYLGGKAKPTTRRKPPGGQCHWKKPADHQDSRVAWEESDPAPAARQDGESLQMTCWQRERGSRRWSPAQHNRTIPICRPKLSARSAK